MFSENSMVLVYDPSDGGVQEQFVTEVAVGDLVYTAKHRFRPVIQILKQALHHGALRSVAGWRVDCFYHTQFFGYCDEYGGVSKQLSANEMVGWYWQRYEDFCSGRVTFEKVTDWRPCYNRSVIRTQDGTIPLLLRNMYSLVVEEDHSFFVNGIAVYDRVFDVGAGVFREFLNRNLEV